MSAAVEPIEVSRPQPDLIDRVANALPEEIRAEYYRELRHCRSLPESDEMLRLLRAMQFLVLLIEQAPSRVAEEREQLDKLLASAIDTIRKSNSANESYHLALQRKLAAIPAEIASGIQPASVAAQINENLRQEFMRSTIPQTAAVMAELAGRMKSASTEISADTDRVARTYKNAAEEAQTAIGSLKAEIALATQSAARFTKEVSESFSKSHRWMMIMLAGGSFVIGLAFGMMMERWLAPPTQMVSPPSAPATQTEPAPESETPKPPKSAKSQTPKAQHPAKP